MLAEIECEVVPPEEDKECVVFTLVCWHERYPKQKQYCG